MAANNKGTDKKPKKYFWIQIKAEDFDGKAFKMMRKQQNGYQMMYIYQRMLLLGGAGNGEIRFEEYGDDLPEEVSLILDEPVEVVRQLFEFMKKFHLIETYESTEDIFMKEFEHYVGGECDSAERTRAWRERKRMQSLGLQASQCDGEVTDGDKSVTQNKINIDIDIKQSKDKTKEKEKSHTYIDAREAHECECEEESDSLDPVLLANFKEIADKYPRADGKTAALPEFIKWIEERCVNGKTYAITYRDVKQAVHNYLESEHDAGREARYLKPLNVVLGDFLVDYLPGNYHKVDDFPTEIDENLPFGNQRQNADWQY